MNLTLYKGNNLRVFYTEDETPRPENFSMHFHPCPELYCFISGDAIYHVEGSEYPLEPGDILLMRPNEAHYVEILSGAPYKRFVIRFDPAIFAALDPEGELMRPFNDRESGKGNLYRKTAFGDYDTWSIFRLFYENQNRRPGSVAALVLLLSAIGKVFEIAPPALAQTETLENRMLIYINARLGEKISLEDMAQFFYISRAQLCRRFKRATGTSVGNFISTKRLLAAQTMLLQGKKPTDVYSWCGYSDYSTFYRSYCKFFGHNPKNEIGLHNEDS